MTEGVIQDRGGGQDRGGLFMTERGYSGQRGFIQDRAGLFITERGYLEPFSLD